MIQIPESGELEDLSRKIEALCKFLKIRLIHVASTRGFEYRAIDASEAILPSETKGL